MGGRLTLLTVRPDGPWPGVGDAGYRQALTGLSGHYPVVLSDATGAPEDARQAAVALADQVVIRADASVAGARTASDLLDRLAAEGRGELARGGVVVFAPARSGVPGTDGRAVAVRHLVAHFRTRCRGVVVLPRRRTRARAAAVLELAALTGDAMADR
ncbi:hypothetical protein KV557_33130 [Kitasatospora aureofaciens]|uniref:hypothetical protein n=1 Tax=Kitasatospora aureofaciens TaxID=1894 RepID=UPI001C4408B9|nr:hypothetical protein [Kitasatospora aureofaciens]MBV6701893.1 hypothetical protein [Kitasatospora aureofaciens]